MLKVQEFLRNGGTLEDLAAANLTICLYVEQRNDGRVFLLKYSPASPKNDPICQECRGLILDEESNWDIVCRFLQPLLLMQEEGRSRLCLVICVFMKR